MPGRFGRKESHRLCGGRKGPARSDRFYAYRTHPEQLPKPGLRRTRTIQAVDNRGLTKIWSLSSPSQIDYEYEHDYDYEGDQDWTESNISVDPLKIAKSFYFLRLVFGITLAKPIHKAHSGFA
jgi:hypothetical protein